MTVIDINQMYSFRLYGNYNYCKKKAFEKILSMFFFAYFFLNWLIYLLINTVYVFLLCKCYVSKFFVMTTQLLLVSFTV